MLEIRINGHWRRVDEYIFRSWTGPRRKNGEPYNGPVYILGTDQTYVRQDG